MPLPEFRLRTLALGLREVSRLVAEEELDLNPPYQRGDVWTEEQRVNLIRSLLMGVPVPALILNLREPTKWEGGAASTYYAVIDGKQRITTAIMWFSGELEVPTSWLSIESVPLDYHKPLITYLNLTRRGQLFQARQFVIPIAEASLASMAAEAEIYGLVNAAGTPQTRADLARAREVAQA